MVKLFGQEAQNLRTVNVIKGDLLLLVYNMPEPNPRLVTFERFLANGDFLSEWGLQLFCPWVSQEGLIIPFTSVAQVHEEISCLANEIYKGRESIIEALEKLPSYFPGEWGIYAHILRYEPQSR